MRVRASKLDIDRVRIYVAGLLGIVLIGILAVELLDGADRSATDANDSTAEVLTLTEYELLSRADTLEPRAYWVGSRPSSENFELEKRDGNTYVRYLTGDDTTGGPRSELLTVASYPVAEAQQQLERAADESGDEKLSHRDGFVLLSSADSQSAYVVFEDQPEIQVEVYSPREGEAARLASGQLTPLHWTPLG